MKMASMAVCHAAATRNRLRHGDPTIGSPEADTLVALGQCRPRLPSGWASDNDFEFEVENTVLNMLGDRALDMILTTADHDESNAQVLADWAETHARQIGNDFCATSFEDGYLPADEMRGPLSATATTRSTSKEPHSIELQRPRQRGQGGQGGQGKFPGMSPVHTDPSVVHHK